MVVTNSLTGGGAERAMNEVCNELNRRGWPVSLVPINSSPPDQVIPTCEVFPLERQWRGGLIGTTAAISRFHKIVRNWNPEIVILNCDLPEFFGATLFFSRQFVVVEHVNRPWISRIAMGLVVRLLLKMRQSKWVAVSSHLSIWPSARTPDSIIENPICLLDLATGDKTKPKRTEKIKRLVFIGRLARQKRPDWLLSISEGSGIPVEVIGEGDLRDYMQKAAIDRKLDFSFQGQRVDPWSEVKNGDLLIVPSKYEGDGLVVIEGMQRELPMLLSDIPDFRRFGFPEVNYCISENDFISSINRFVFDISKLRIPSEISNHILSGRNPKVVGDKWEEFLNSI